MSGWPEAHSTDLSMTPGLRLPGARQPVKILFLLRHPLYLRNYESVLRELAARGHRVELIFSSLPTARSSMR